jgi:hypothetical protein
VNNSGFIICRAPLEDDSDRLLELYRSMRTPELHLLQAAFLLDLQELTNPESIAFCDRRVALIDQVLHEREAAQ